MAKKRVWRALGTITSSLLVFSLGAGSIAEAWRENID